MNDDVKEIKVDVKELLKLSAVHNEILRTHDARSLALQAGQEKLDVRLRPIEEHVSLVSKLLKAAGAVLVVLLGQALIRGLL